MENIDELPDNFDEAYNWFSRMYSEHKTLIDPLSTQDGRVSGQEGHLNEPLSSEQLLNQHEQQAFSNFLDNVLEDPKHAADSRELPWLDHTTDEFGVQGGVERRMPQTDFYRGFRDSNPNWASAAPTPLPGQHPNHVQQAFGGYEGYDRFPPRQGMVIPKYEHGNALIPGDTLHQAQKLMGPVQGSWNGGGSPHQQLLTPQHTSSQVPPQPNPNKYVSSAAGRQLVPNSPILSFERSPHASPGAQSPRAPPSAIPPLQSLGHPQQNQPAHISALPQQPVVQQAMGHSRKRSIDQQTRQQQHQQQAPGAPAQTPYSRASPVSRSKKRREYLSEDQVRRNHIISEKRRRDLISNSYQTMCSLVPTAQSNLPKSTVLTCVYEYLLEIGKENENIRKTLHDHGVDTSLVPARPLGEPLPQSPVSPT